MLATRRILAACFVIAPALAACQHGATETVSAVAPRPSPARADQVGLASWYGAGFHNRRTASGERFNPRALTAAHPSLPIGTVLRVTNLANDRHVDVRVNDRGPFTGRRIIDLSRASAQQLDMIRAGQSRVALTVLRDEADSHALTTPPLRTASPDPGNASPWTRLPNLAQRTRVADALAFTGPDADFLP